MNGMKQRSTKEYEHDERLIRDRRQYNIERENRLGIDARTRRIGKRAAAQQKARAVPNAPRRTNYYHPDQAVYQLTTDASFKVDPEILKVAQRILRSQATRERHAKAQKSSLLAAPLKPLHCQRSAQAVDDAVPSTSQNSPPAISRGKSAQGEGENPQEAQAPQPAWNGEERILRPRKPFQPLQNAARAEERVETMRPARQDSSDENSEEEPYYPRFREALVKIRGEHEISMEPRKSILSAKEQDWQVAMDEWNKVRGQSAEPLFLMDFSRSRLPSFEYIRRPILSEMAIRKLEDMKEGEMPPAQYSRRCRCEDVCCSFGDRLNKVIVKGDGSLRLDKSRYILHQATALWAHFCLPNCSRRGCDQART